MIIKKREIPISIPKMQALLRRIPPDHPKIPLIQENLLKYLSDYSVLERFQISKKELVTGVHCSICNKIPLLRIHGYWYCTMCNQKYLDAHKESIKDYSYLWSSTITSKQLKHFLHISCSSLATRILKTMNLPLTGSKKGTVYDLSSLRQ